MVISGDWFAAGLVLSVWLTVSIAFGVDAVRRGRSGGVWLLTVFLLGPLGVLIYIFVVMNALSKPD
jgi:hypothetical protein